MAGTAPGAGSRLLRAVGAVLIGVVVAAWFAFGPGSGSDDGGGSRSTARSTASAGSGATGGSTATDGTGLASVAASDLPVQARTTLRLIAAGGPFPYSRDGITFGNRERLLPQKPVGYYREYTVPTPGESDRGARRIIAGDAGERYWTADHYASFARIRGQG